MILACRSQERAEAAAFDIRRVSAAGTHAAAAAPARHGERLSGLYFLFPGQRQRPGGLHAPGSGEPHVRPPLR